MRILQVITSLNIGGAERLFVQLVEKLQEKGHQVDACIFNGEETDFLGSLERLGCNIYKMGHQYYNPNYISKLSGIMGNYDIVHTHNSSPQLFAAIAKGHKPCRLITTEHNTDNRKRHLPWFAKLERWMYSKYDKVICISKQTEDALRHYLGDRWIILHGSNRILTIENGIDVKRFQGAEASIPRDSRPIIVMVAAFRPQKDHSSLLRAMCLLPDDYRLWLVGDGETRDAVEREIGRLGLEDRVRLFGNRPDVPGILKSADVVVMSSNWEGFGLAAVEGMAAGKPVVASDVEGLRQIVEGYGETFPKGDEKILAQKIKSLCSDSLLYKQVAQQCGERARAFDIQVMIDGYEQVYLDAMANQG